MQAYSFRFTIAAAAAATAVANTENKFSDYLVSNHCQNDKKPILLQKTL
jgi:hypothetical protein